MADMTGSRFLGGCIGLAVLGTILYGLGFASPFWFDYQMNNRRVYGGLFIVCDPDGLQRECYSIYNSFSEFTEAWLPATEGMACLGLLCALGGIIAAIVWACVGSSKAVCSVTAFCFIFAGIFGVISVAVYGSMSEFKVKDLSWAYWLTVIGCAFYFITGILATVASCTQNKVWHLDD